MKLTPSRYGFTMPAEWATHQCTWTAWPHGEELWCGYLEEVRKEFTIFLNTLSKYEPVSLIVSDEESLIDAKKRLTGNVTFYNIPHNDLWLRDSGPTFITKSNQVAGINWIFNGWGNKYSCALDNNIPVEIKKINDLPLFSPAVVMEGGSLEVNGEGCVLTTKQCLLSLQRNQELELEQLEIVLKDYLGVSKILWLENGLEGDHTDGHIDTIARFTDANTIVAVECHDPSDANYETTRKNLSDLRSFTNTSGKPFNVVSLPLPIIRRELEGERLPPTYANFYIANNVVIVPLYDDPNDDKAMDILKPLFPNHTVIGLSAKNLITGGGAFHCVTQQQPFGSYWEGI